MSVYSESDVKYELSQQETADSSPKPTKEIHSADFNIRKKPIRKSAFLSRKEAMFGYMERVENINKMLMTQKAKQKKQKAIKEQKSARTLLNFLSICEDLPKKNTDLSKQVMDLAHSQLKNRQIDQRQIPTKVY